MKGRCACGQVTVTVAHPPEYINFCNCSLCRRIGGGWGYYDRDEVIVSGEVRGFVRSDLKPEETCLETRFCPTCGAVVCWVPLPSFDSRRMGVNMRLFEPEELKGIETRFPDGINWAGERLDERHPCLPYGEGTVF